MTRPFLFSSGVSAVLLLGAAVLALHSPHAAWLAAPAALLHGAVLVAFKRSARARTRAYYPVIRLPALLSVALIASVPLAGLVGPWLRFLAAWAAALASLAAFHMEYQSVRESEHARTLYRNADQGPQ